ncbi:ABC transporter permease subunit [Bosea sp. F3-2]|nr:ABC transporter permease subunit [Bosea sp. F3-2]
MPSATLGRVHVALIARITRATMLEVIQQDYVRTAQAKGMSQKDVLFLHSLRNAAVPAAMGPPSNMAAKPPCMRLKPGHSSGAGQKR